MARGGRPKAPILLVGGDDDDLLVFGSLSEAGTALDPQHLPAGLLAYDARGRRLRMVPRRLRSVGFEVEGEGPEHAAALRDRLVAWLAATPARAPDDAAVELPELVRRVRTQARRMAGRGPMKVALLLIWLLLFFPTWLGLCWVAHRVHRLGHPPLPFLRLRSEAAGFLIVLPAVFAAIPLSLALTNAVGHALPWLGPRLALEARLGLQPDLRSAQRGLLRATAWALAIAVPLMLLGALWPFERR